MSKHQSFAPDDRERPAPSTRKERKTVVVEYKAKPGRATLFFSDWVKFGSYTNRKRAEQVLQAKTSDPYFEYRVRPDLEPKTYYDVQMTLGGSKRTILKGKFAVQQDINKN